MKNGEFHSEVKFSLGSAADLSLWASVMEERFDVRLLPVSTKLLENYAVAEDFPFWIQKNVHDAQDSPGLHGHDFVEMIFVVEGFATHKYEDISYDVRAGDVFIINPGEMHGYELQAGQQMEIINCLFHPGLIQQSLLQQLDMIHSMDFFYVQPFLHKDKRFHHKLNLRGEAADRLLFIFGDMLEEMEKRVSGYRALVQLKMVELLIRLSRYYEVQERELEQGTTVLTAPSFSSRSELLVKRICGYLERHYDSKIALTDISKLFHIGIRQLNRQFKRYNDCSVIEYVHRLRIERAKCLLAETDETIAAVAAAIGYEDATFFNKLFGRRVGCSPGRYREMNNSMED
ncbi:AraC family transcriptional regulator [Paenibacillus eucommiae]|uniref:AraC family L-rhamnose operon regulatory protein RhaS n=1 Tax=Paenibacillus eucommiae TaxID=1355755 RepID=A0ABS4IX73_9BACL|nr:AraC family transcriptional regulator [Paenibacillus eucommiae]MBP1991690.1 AraC family L-rhamnose operon regulatory protein RhaS [Paenibacillus eucommiae]